MVKKYFIFCRNFLILYLNENQFVVYYKEIFFISRKSAKTVIFGDIYGKAF